MARKSKSASDSIKVSGFCRVAFFNKETGALEWDSGYQKNTLVDGGMTVVVQRLASSGANAGSYPTYMDVGTQTLGVSSNQTELTGALGVRSVVNRTTATSGASYVARFTASWDSTQATQSTLGALALYGTNTGAALSIVLLQSTVNKSSTQTMNATYEWRFATA